MRIGLVSDTHIWQDGEALPPELIEIFQGVDLILHAGDIFSLHVLDELERIAPVLAARGDDDYAYSTRDKRVKDLHILKLEGHTLWLVHEKPYYLNLQRSPTEPSAVLNPDEKPIHLDFQRWQSIFPYMPKKDERPGIVVFGHEHRTVVEQVNDILFICSGSPTFLGYENGLGTAAILELNGGKPEVQILQL
jgi:uncharacterized protein